MRQPQIAVVVRCLRRVCARECDLPGPAVAYATHGSRERAVAVERRGAAAGEGRGLPVRFASNMCTSAPVSVRHTPSCTNARSPYRRTMLPHAMARKPRACREYSNDRCGQSVRAVRGASAAWARRSRADGAPAAVEAQGKLDGPQ